MIVSAPAFSALVVIVAMSVLPIVVCIAAGSTVLSLEVNTTVPVGAAPFTPATVAVKVTLCPNTLVGFIAPLLLVTVVVLVAFVTLCKAVPLLAASLLLPA